jgi:hypothetical protein
MLPFNWHNGFNPTVKGGSHQRISKAFNIPKNELVAVHKCPTSYRLVAQEHQAAVDQLTKEFEAKLSVVVNERVQEAKEAVTACLNKEFELKLNEAKEVTGTASDRLPPRPMKVLVHGPDNKALMTEIIKDLLKGKVTKDLKKAS